jgi:hypothetical protein
MPSAAFRWVAVKANKALGGIRLDAVKIKERGGGRSLQRGWPVQSFRKKSTRLAARGPIGYLYAAIGLAQTARPVCVRIAARFGVAAEPAP